jgi:hypothetical protein
VLKMNWRVDGRNTPISVMLSPFQSPVIGITVLSPKVVRVSGAVLKMNFCAEGRNTPMLDREPAGGAFTVIYPVFRVLLYPSEL